MNLHKHSPVLVAGLATAAVIAIFVGSLLSTRAYGTSPVLVAYLIPIWFSAVYGGLAAGWLTIFLSFALSIFLLMVQANGSWIGFPEYWVRLVTLVVVGVLVNLLAESRRKTIAARDALVGKQAELEAENRQRMQAEEQVRAERDRFFITLTSIGDGALVTDPNGNVDLINPIAQELTGWSQNEARGKPLASVFHILNEYTRASVENPVEKVLKTGSVVGLANHTILVSRDGREIPIDDSAAPIRSDDGKILGVILIFRDISDHHGAEAALQESDRRKDEFLAMLAHELRNPIAPIVSAVQILQRQNHTEFQHDWACGVIERQAHHLARLVDDLLDVSRINRGKITLDMEPVELDTMIHHAIETSRPVIEANHHNLEVTLPRNPIWVQGDLIRLAQIVSNLLNNAAKYSEACGYIRLSATEEDGWAVVRVKDDGMGISPDLLPRVFDLFAQADRSLDRSKGGLGIGLSLARQLVELHGGTVEAKSEGIGQGSEFIVRLPLLATAPMLDAMEIPVTPVLRPEKIQRVLVVDDNEDAAEGLATLLETEGCEVERAADGPVALRVADHFHPDVVLLDIGLPGMDGYAVARRMRTQPHTRDALIIAVSGYGQEQDRQHSMEAGFDDHLTKPVALEEIIQAMHRHSAAVAGRAAAANPRAPQQRG